MLYSLKSDTFIMLFQGLLVFFMCLKPCVFIGCFVCNDIKFLEDHLKNKLQMPKTYPRCDGGDGIKFKSCSGSCGKMLYGEGNGSMYDTCLEM